MLKYGMWYREKKKSGKEDDKNLVFSFDEKKEESTSEESEFEFENHQNGLDEKKRGCKINKRINF